MRFLLVALLAVASFGRADSITYGGPCGSVAVATGTTTTTNTASEQTIISYVALRPVIIQGVYLDLTNLTIVTAVLKSYVTRSGGAAVLRGLFGLLTGSFTWTSATDADGMNLLTTPVLLNTGDTYEAKITLVSGEAKVINYLIGYMQ